MKRMLFSLLMAVICSGLFAQSVDKAKDLLKANKIAEAKDEIDKVLLVEKNQKNAEAWYAKVKIYNAIAANPQLKAQYPDALFQSFEALKNYTQYDDKKLISLTLDQYKPINEIYIGLVEDGSANVKALKYPDALTDFKTAIAAVAFMNKEGWTKQNMDTISTYYAGYSAENSNKRDEALTYYKIIIDSGVTKIHGYDMAEIYKWVADYYTRKGDKENAAKYISMGKSKYPNDIFYDELSLDMLRKSGPKDSLFALYERITVEHPDSASYLFDYGLELYQYATDSSSGKRVANYQDLINKAKDKLLASLKINPNFPQASLMVGTIYYNEGVEFQVLGKPKGNTNAEELKKRQDYRAQSAKKFDDAIPYLEKVDQLLGSKTKLRKPDKDALKDAYDSLINIYEAKKDKTKIDFWTEKYNSVEKLH
jgi:tetratricopeptide repeat protein